jgi:hypothetical protein
MLLEDKKRLLRESLNKWNEYRWSEDKAYKLLNSGTFFIISYEQMERWNEKNPEFLHCYFSVVNDKMRFVLIDNETDKIPFSLITEEQFQYIYIVDFRADMMLGKHDFLEDATSSGELTLNEALSRNLRWELVKERWVEEKIDSTDGSPVGIGRVFKAPFGDISSVTKEEEVVAIMGLKHVENNQVENNYELDLTFWKREIKPENIINITLLSGGSGLPVEDLTAVSPPYADDDQFSLIKSGN